MSELSTAAAEAFASQYANYAKELHKWTDPLDDDQFWHKPFSYGNSVGHLVLHITGNLNYYVGARIAQTGYVRNRDLEFTESARPEKDTAICKFDEVIAMVLSTIRSQSEADWTLPYSAEREMESKDRFTLFLRCAAHFYHHVGQVNYLSRALSK